MITRYALFEGTVASPARPTPSAPPCWQRLLPEMAALSRSTAVRVTFAESRVMTARRNIR